jgi:hypothetical protein
MIEMGKKYRTRDGRDVRIYAVDGAGDYPVHGAVVSVDGRWVQYAWTAEGVMFVSLSPLNLIEVKEKIRRTVWINVYPEGVVGNVTIYPSKRRADEDAAFHRLACVKVEIECEEGEGL